VLGTLEAHKQCFLFWANFHNLVRQKEEGAQGKKGFFCNQMGSRHHIMRGKKNLKLPYLENKFQQVTKL
jgi:hypothetical protein